MKASDPVRRELTEEEKKEQAIRALLQERKMLVQGIAFNASGNPSVTTDTTPQTFAQCVISSADAIIKELYTATDKEQKNGK